MILDKIIESKYKEVDEKKNNISLSELKNIINTIPKPCGFKKALHQKNGLPAVIAEVKKASPSKGIIREDFNPIEIAKIYEEGGASAISVLTDEKFFQGNLDYLKEIKKEVSIPILRKDFIIDEYQVYEARAAGADAFLLIVSALSKDKIIELQTIGRKLGMDVLVEVHDEAEMLMAIDCKCDPIGVNNRNLKTFETNINITYQLRPLAKDCTFVSESGIFTRDDVKKLAEAGVDAVLIGEALMKEDDIINKLREFTT
ncbi:MAG: indole-3-glycerol phosphate synthase TrpC [Armatimonadota bacterium]